MKNKIAFVLASRLFDLTAPCHIKSRVKIKTCIRVGRRIPNRILSPGFKLMKKLIITMKTQRSIFCTLVICRSRTKLVRNVIAIIKALNPSKSWDSKRVPRDRKSRIFLPE